MITIDSGSLRQLLTEAGDDVLSLYLAVDPTDPNNQRSAGSEAWRIWLKNALKDLEQDGDRDARQRWRRRTERLDRFMNSYQPGGRSLALLLDEERQWSAELPIRLEPEAGYGEPRVGPLLWAIDEHQHYFTVLVSADVVRIVSMYLGHVGDVAHMELDRNWGMPGATRSAHQFRFEAHREEHQRGHQQRIADEVSKAVFENPDVDRVVLAGSEREAHGVRNFMHPRAAQAVVSVLGIPVESSDADIVERIQPVAAQYERDRELEIVEHVIGLARARGRGVTGASETLDCVDRQMVRTLVLATPIDDEAWAEDVLRRAFESSARVEFVHGPAAEKLNKAGGVAAELYYSP